MNLSRRRKSSSYYQPSRRYQKKTSIVKVPTSLPEKIRVRLTFATSGLFAVTSTAPQSLIVATQINPFGSAVNAQGWDQWANMYLKWRPVGMTLTLNAGIPSVASAGTTCLMRGYWSQYATPIGSDLGMIQNRYTKTLYISEQTGFASMTTSSRLYDVWGMTQSEWMNDDTTQADVTANPSKITRYYYHFNTPDWLTPNNYTIRYECRGSMEIEFSCARILMDA